MDKPNIFISWSGDRSKFVADALRQWLPKVLQLARPWMSQKDIEKGTQGLQEIANALESAQIGVVCLTPENADERWILYEAGALSKSVNNDKTRLCTLLLGGLTFQDVKPPLGNFQHTKPEREDFWRLIQSINNALSDSPIPEEHLSETFEALWPRFEATLRKLPAPKAQPQPPQKRTADEMLAEILDNVRGGKDREIEELRKELVRMENELRARSGEFVAARATKATDLSQFLNEVLAEGVNADGRRQGRLEQLLFKQKTGKVSGTN